MANKKERTEGKRVAKKSKGFKAPLAAACAIGVIAALYIGLCAWAGSHVLPNSSAAGVELGGLSTADAEARLEQAARKWRGQSVPLTFNGQSVPCELDKAEVGFDTETVLEQLTARDSFPLRGAAWIKALVSGEGRQAENAMLFEDQLYMDGLLTELNSAMSNPVEQHSVTVGETDIRIAVGHAGQAIDTVTLEETLLAKLEAEDLSDLELTAQITQPDEIDWEALHSEIYVEAANAALDGETFEITPSVTGVSFDIATAQALYERTGAGESFTIPLVFTEPEITTEKMEASLFADVLGEGKSNVSGSSGRRANVKLAGELCDGTILLPGEEFSYWSKIAPCTKEQGFQEAPTYRNGETVPGVGGGVCQMSSTIYTACLYANLEIVERRNHTYAVGYLDNGSDAMVSEGTSDFRFKNNTQWPIKLVITMEGQKLTVQVWGTKTDDTYVKMEFNDLSSNPYTTVYKIDDSVPAGTTKVSVTGYNGYKNETYRCVYAGDGTLISRTLESKNSYARRDRIVLINSADAAKYGLDAGGKPLPEATPTPTPTPAPATTPEVTPSDSGTDPGQPDGGTAAQEPSLAPEPTTEASSEIPDWLKPAGSEDNAA